MVVGHLLPYVGPNEAMDMVFILRCSPKVLRKRYLKRGYTQKKIDENLEAEVIGVISEKCSEVYDQPKLAEVDTSKSTNAASTATTILDIIIGKKQKTFGVIDWLSYAKSPSSLESLLKGKYHILNKTKKDN
ncbi:MAG: AAA family ATPase [Nitrososphaerales archaeon]